MLNTHLSLEVIDYFFTYFLHAMDVKELNRERQILEVQQAEIKSLRLGASVYRQYVQGSNVFYLTSRIDINTHLREKEKQLREAEKNI